MIKAKIRMDILEDGLSIPLLSGNTLNTKQEFFAMQPDDLDEEEFNTIIFVPGKRILDRCLSIDLEFEPFEEKNPFDEIRKFMIQVEKDAGEHQTDINFYNMEQWKERGETFGNEAPLSVTFEGFWYEVLNYPNNKYFKILYDDFYKKCAELGLLFEQGYAWSGHFHKGKKGFVFSVNVFEEGIFKEDACSNLLNKLSNSNLKLVGKVMENATEI